MDDNNWDLYGIDWTGPVPADGARIENGVDVPETVVPVTDEMRNELNETLYETNNKRGDIMDQYYVVRDYVKSYSQRRGSPDVKQSDIEQRK